MRSFRPRLTVRRLLAAIAFLAVSFGLIRLNTDSPARRFQTDLFVDFVPTAASERDGHGDSPAPQDWPTRLRGLTAPAVLDAALAADGHFSTLPRISKAADPRAEFRRMLHVQRDDSTGRVRITIEGRIPAEPTLAVGPLTEAILSQGPPGARVTRAPYRMRMPLEPAVLDRGWKVAAAALVVILGTTAILFLPTGSMRPSGAGGPRPPGDSAS
ncbi:MAG: hypothetical protein ACYC61_14075 [Isosphaeraceae bacterium]